MEVRYQHHTIQQTERALAHLRHVVKERKTRIPALIDTMERRLKTLGVRCYDVLVTDPESARGYFSVIFFVNPVKATIKNFKKHIGKLSFPFVLDDSLQQYNRIGLTEIGEGVSKENSGQWRLQFEYVWW